MTTRNPAEKSRVWAQRFKADDSPAMYHHLLIRWTFLWSLLSMVKGSICWLLQLLLHPWRQGLIHPPDWNRCLSWSPWGDATHHSQKKSILTLLLNVCQVLGLPTYYPQAAFNRGSMIPLGERTPSPVTGRGERDSGVITWIPSIGWWCCCSLPLMDIGSCLSR